MREKKNYKDSSAKRGVSLIFSFSEWLTILQFNISTARKLQQKLAKQVTVKEIRLDAINLIAGADDSYKNNIVTSAIVLLKYNTLSLVELKRVESDRVSLYSNTISIQRSFAYP